eukprot:scaffold11508_cov84-Isochrysis_galbana.AAC.1
MLDEECALPRGSEASLVHKLHTMHGASPAVFGRPPPPSSRPARAGRSGSASSAGGGAGLPRPPGALICSGGGAATPPAPPPQFVVKHYAAEVTYTVDGWIDRNRGLLRPEVQVRAVPPPPPPRE